MVFPLFQGGRTFRVGYSPRNIRVGANSSQLMPDHILGNIDWHVLPPVMDGDGVPYHLREKSSSLRAQVLMTLFSPGLFISSIFLRRFRVNIRALSLMNVTRLSSLSISI